MSENDEILVLSAGDVERLLPMSECIPLMSEALAALARGEVANPLRSVVRPPKAKHLLGLMPAYRGGANAAYALKEVCVFPDNPSRGLDAHQGSVLLHSAETGELLSVMSGSAVTAIRTAAVSGVATKLLARDDARVLAVIGAGVQARTHLEAMAIVGSFEQARVASRSGRSAARLVEELSGRYPFELVAAQDNERAVRDADVVVTVTSSREPVLRREWIRPGAHVNAVGSSMPTAREIDTATMLAATLFVDRRESTLAESGDYLFASREGPIGPEHIRAELGELLVGEEHGRSFPEELTLFESLGLAVEDLAAAQFLYRVATEKGVGARVRF